MPRVGGVGDRRSPLIQRAPLTYPEIREFYAAAELALPDSRVTLLEVWDFEDHLGCWFDLRGTGVFERGLTILRFRDGRCIERWSMVVPWGLGGLNASHGGPDGDRCPPWR